MWYIVKDNINFVNPFKLSSACAHSIHHFLFLREIFQIVKDSRLRIFNREYDFIWDKFSMF